MNTESQPTELIWENDDEPPPDLFLDRFLTDLFAHLEMPRPELSILVTDDARMRDLNRDYRQKDKTTDVLSFPANVTAHGDEPGFLGDIAISAPTAQLQAREIGHGYAQEIRFLVLHGVLHLLGYDHETDDGQMLALQKQLKQKLSNYFTNHGG